MANRSRSNSRSNPLHRMTSFRLEQYVVTGKPASTTRNPHPADLRMKIQARSARAASEMFLAKCQKQCPERKRGKVLSVTRCSDDNNAIVAHAAAVGGSGAACITVKSDTRTLYREYLLNHEIQILFESCDLYPTLKSISVVISQTFEQLQSSLIFVPPSQVPGPRIQASRDQIHVRKDKHS